MILGIITPFRFSRNNRDSSNSSSNSNDNSNSNRSSSSTSDPHTHVRDCRQDITRVNVCFYVTG